MLAEAEELILATLRQLGVTLPSSISDIGQLETATIVASCARCLNVIHEAQGSDQRFAEALPANPGVRFRLCTSLARAIAGLGYTEEVGFNNFLYPNAKDTRKLLLYLVDAMPRSEATGDGFALGAGGFEEQLQQARRRPRARRLPTPAERPAPAQAVRRCAQAPWKPPGWRVQRAADPVVRRLRAAVLSGALANSRQQEHQERLEEDLLLGGREAGAAARARGGLGAADGDGGTGIAAVQPFGGLFAHASEFAHRDAFAAPSADSDSGETALQRAERAEEQRVQEVIAQLEATRAQLAGRRAAVDAARAAIAELRPAQVQADAVASAGEAEVKAVEAGYRVQMRTLQLAADPDKSRVELQRAAEQGAAALNELEREWEQRRTPLAAGLDEHERAQRERRAGAERKLASTRALRSDSKTMVTQLQERDETCRKLQDALAAAIEAAPRTTYTRRIMEIVKNVRKQKVEIDKILGHVKALQKEFNASSVTLGRSFATADEIIFREAVRDAAAKQVYKGLAAIHEAFGQLGDMAQEIANGTNASRELQSRIDELAAREYGDAIDRLSKDLVAIAK